MLNVPEEVKALFKRDDVYKNFRVHFPNGETADFDNSSIVSESVKFTESLCSQQSFRFGLTEASQISFTAVNIPNIRGVTIECALDIDVSSLGMTWINANLSPDGFDFLSLACYLNESEDGGFYRIPYGRFIVDTCPRNHESMWKREIAAYSERFDNGALVNPFQTQFMNAMWAERPTYTPSVSGLFYANIGNIDRSIIDSAGYTKIPLVSQDPSYPEYAIISVYINNLKNAQYEEVPLTWKVIGGHYEAPISQYYTEASNLYEFEWNDGDINRNLVKSMFVELLERWSVDATASGYESLDAIAEKYISASESGSVGRNDYEVVVKNGYTITSAGYGISVDNPIHSNTSIICPYMNDSAIYISKPTRMTMTFNETETATINYPSVDLYVLERSSHVDDLISISNTLETNYKIDTKVTKAYSFANAFSMNDLIQGFLELQCEFLSPSRTGGFEITELDNSAPFEIVPSEYSDLWFDETVISPIGYVEVKFKDESGNDQDVIVQIGDGASIYDLRDNEVLSNMIFSVSETEAEAGITIQSKLIAYLNSIFTPSIPDLTFVPIELSKKGLPYLEAGDAIEIETEDGQIVPSFILRQTITGIQFLSADVESSNGEAMEMIET